jgi:hypothetical protein
MAANRQVERPGSRPKSKAVKDTDKVEDKLLDIYGGRDPAALPTTLMFDHVSPATRLLEKRRQMFEVQEALNSQKDEFNRREDAYRRREDGLRRKDLELQESLIKFNKFLQENESKRYRAQRRAAEERKQQDIKAEDCATIVERCDRLSISSSSTMPDTRFTSSLKSSTISGWTRRDLRPSSLSL